ncbi:MAG: sulfatase, partial [Verrucomicrobiota bacterium]
MKKHYEEWHVEAKELYDRPRWITIGNEAENPLVLYSQDWVGDYCDNPGGLSAATAHGYWNVDVHRAGVYEIELRRWPKESGKTLTEGWAKGPGGVARSARPIAAANLSIASKNFTLDTKTKDTNAAFHVELPAGKTQLSTLFLNADDQSLCSAIYVYVRRLADGDEAKLTPVSNRKSAGRLPAPKKGKAKKARPKPAASTSKPAAAGSKPNIVLIFIDDMGYGDIGPFGNTVNKTPNLDRMAAEGNVLTQFYVANTACTPSRAALLTGSYAHRIGMDGTVCFPGEDRGLNPDEITIAEVLKERGYDTGCFGKWHLGDQKPFLPLAQGFDQYFGIPYSNDMWPGNKRGNPITNRGPYEPLPIIRQNEAVAYVTDGADQSLLAEVITDEAVEFIREHKDKPFFCYVPHSHVHNPRFARAEMLDRAEGNVSRATVEEVDDSVGRILDTIREAGIAENTLVIFTSDNGGAGGMSMGPLRGGKGGPKYEGHMRVPTVAWWPGTIEAGNKTDEIAVTTDLLPTFAKLTGGEVPNDRPIDGKDVVDILLGKDDAQSPHDVLYYEVEGIRRDNWKLVKGRERIELYDLETDLGEKKDLAQKHPDIVTELQQLLEAHAKRISEDTRPAAFVDDAKPILKETGNLPRLRELMGIPDVRAAEPAPQPKPAPQAGAARRPFRIEVTPVKYEPDNSDLLIADFEGGDYGNWEVVGEAFSEK